MPSQLSRAHDVRRRPDQLLGVAQMPNWLESGSGWRLGGERSRHQVAPTAGPTLPHVAGGGEGGLGASGGC
eukprot:3804113-Rhodomonas_salina.1